MIRVDVHPEQINKCVEFARSIISQNNQYNRFSKSPYVQAVRTYVGKLGELVFADYLINQGISINRDELFAIFPGQSNVDDHDFITSCGMSVDIKTASLPFHSRIMVPMTQYHLKKDFYIGVKLHFDLRDDDHIAPKSIQSATIHGYATRQEMDKSPTRSYGEGECKWIKLDELNPIHDLVKKFNKKGD